jgi:hypothetical protein
MALLEDGQLRISMTATKIDEEQQLLYQEFFTERATTFDDALSAIRNGVVGFGGQKTS